MFLPSRWRESRYFGSSSIPSSPGRTPRGFHSWFVTIEPQFQVMTSMILSRHPAQVTVCNRVSEAVDGAHAIVVCTEWDEFRDLDYQSIYDRMHKPGS